MYAFRGTPAVLISPGRFLFNSFFNEAIEAAFRLALKPLISGYAEYLLGQQDGFLLAPFFLPENHLKAGMQEFVIGFF